MPRFPRFRHPRLASLALATCAALGTGVGAFAADRPADSNGKDAPRSAARADDRSDKVCRRVRPVGSNIPQTICRTRQQMAEEEAAARAALDGNRVRQD